LLDDPKTRRVCRAVAVQNPAAILSNDEATVEHSAVDCRGGEYVDRCDGLSMIAEKGKPTVPELGIPRRPFHPARNRTLGDIKPQQQKFAVNPWGSPRGIFSDHAKDQLSNLLWSRLPANCLAGVGDQPPIELKASSMPLDHGVGGDDDEGLLPPGLELSCNDPEQFVKRT
jgi:hypothetical protein